MEGRTEGRKVGKRDSEGWTEGRKVYRMSQLVLEPYIGKAIKAITI